MQPLNGAQTVECGDEGAEYEREGTYNQGGIFLFLHAQIS